MEIKKIIVGRSFGYFSMNAYLIINNGKTIIIDPGDEAEKIIKTIKDERLLPISIILTHAHIDHIKDTAEISAYYKIPVYIHEDEKVILGSNDYNLTNAFGKPLRRFDIQRYLKDNEKIGLEGAELRIIHTPGHTPGGLCIKGGNFLISGDTLFASSIGRSDFPCGDEEQLIRSIKEKLLILDDYIIVYPGHEGETTIGKEKRNWGLH